MIISIITINYNNRAGLQKTIGSVITQTFKNIEYIVIDGDSNDGSLDVIKENAANITHWVSEKDSGIYNAQNKGIKLATGKYLLFLNSGDYLENSQVIELLAKENADEDLIYGNLKRIFPDGSTDVVKMPDTINLERLIHDTLCHPVTLIKKTLFTQYGLYDENVKIVADWAFFLKIFVYGKPVYKHKDVTVAVFYMDGVSSHAANQQSLYLERERVIAEYVSPAILAVINEKDKYQYLVKRYGLEKVHALLKSIKSKMRFSKSQKEEIVDKK